MPDLPLPLFLMLLRLSGRHRRFESEARLRSAVQRERQRVMGEPPPDFERRFHLSQRRVNGSPCYRLSATEGSSATQVLYLHGGAHCAEISPFHWRFIAGLAQASGCTFHVPLFPLAPEHRQREVFLMVAETYRTLCAESGGRARIVLMGDSSGGNLALSLAQHLPELGLPAPADIVLLSPWLDMSNSQARQAAARVDDPWLRLPGMDAAAGWWARGEDLSQPRFSPLHGRLKDIGRITVFVGTRELVLNECRLLRQRAQAQGVEVGWVEEAGMIHVWPLLPLRRARKARERIAQILAGHPLQSSPA